MDSTTSLRILSSCGSAHHWHFSFLSFSYKTRRSDVYSSQIHFEIEVSGVFFGPELNKVRDYFQETEIRVYAVVSEESRPASKGLY